MVDDDLQALAKIRRQYLACIDLTAVGEFDNKTVIKVQVRVGDRDAILAVYAVSAVSTILARAAIFAVFAWTTITAVGAVPSIGADKTANYTFVLNDQYQELIVVNSGSARDVLIPTDASVAFAIGTVITVYNEGAGLVTIKAVTPGTTTVQSRGAVAASPTLASFGSFGDEVPTHPGGHANNVFVCDPLFLRLQTNKM